jgi:hypothetical protein
MKKCQYEKYKKAISHQKQANPQQMAIVLDRIETTNDLQIAIIKTIDESDSLLEGLLKKDGSDETKAPIADELKNLNSQLHILVYNLTTQMEEILAENESLKSSLNNTVDKKESTTEELAAESEIEPDLPPLELPTFDFDDKNNH